jgi:hypothetical protein
MNKRFIVQAVTQKRVIWQRHAFERMMERGISRDGVKQALLDGEFIEEYPDDNPLPSGLILGFVNEIPLHVVIGIDKESKYCYIITAYRPDSEYFESDYKTRK